MPGMLLQPLLNLRNPPLGFWLVDFPSVLFTDHLIHKPLEKRLHVPPFSLPAYHKIRG